MIANHASRRATQLYDRRSRCGLRCKIMNDAQNGACWRDAALVHTGVTLGSTPCARRHKSQKRTLLRRRKPNIATSRWGIPYGDGLCSTSSYSAEGRCGAFPPLKPHPISTVSLPRVRSGTGRETSPSTSHFGAPRRSPRSSRSSHRRPLDHGCFNYTQKLHHVDERDPASNRLLGMTPTCLPVRRYA